jgi:hypothetical protein
MSHLHSLTFLFYILAVLRIHAIFMWICIWIRGSMPLANGTDRDSGPDPDPAIFVIDVQDANKKLNYCFCSYDYYFLKVHLHHFSKIKS